jgi:hypothetical protein
MARETKTRPVQCPRCGTTFEVAQAAMSMLCPGCHIPVRTEDVKVKTFCAVTEFHTAGDVVVEKAGMIQAVVRVCNLEVKGEIRGPVYARGLVALRKTAKVTGPLRAPRLAVEAGAVLVGRVEVGPDVDVTSVPKPAPPRTDLGAVPA